MVSRSEFMAKGFRSAATVYSLRRLKWVLIGGHNVSHKKIAHRARLWAIEDLVAVILELFYRNQIEGY